MSKSILITGAGVISAIGADKGETFRSLAGRISGVSAPRLLSTGHADLPCGEVPKSDGDLSEALGIGGGAVSRAALLGIWAVREALSQAGLTVDGGLDKSFRRVAFINATTVGGMDITERHWLEYLEGRDDPSRLVPLHDCGGCTGQIADYFGGFSYVSTVSTACSSAANAIIMAASLIRSGNYDIVVAGGTESLTRYHLNGFNSLMILDGERCRPFDATRAGLNLGEGAGFLVLESAESANLRGAKVLAELRGWGNACDAFHQTASSDDGEGAFLAMEEALSSAGLTPDDIGYINAHGTGTPNNDASESAALSRVFGSFVPPVSSTKAYTGHTTSASGGIEAVICLIALENQFLPVNLGFSEPFEGGVIPVTDPAVSAPLKHVLCNSFGFGGNDSSLLISAVPGPGGAVWGVSGSLRSSLPSSMGPSLFDRGRTTIDTPDSTSRDRLHVTLPDIQLDSTSFDRRGTTIDAPDSTSGDRLHVTLPVIQPDSTAFDRRGTTVDTPDSTSGTGARVFILSASQISAQEPLSDEWTDNPVRPEGKYVRAKDPQWRDHLNPMLSRRMGTLMKRTLVTSLTAMEAAGDRQCDSIITGTGLGCMENTERFLRKMLTEGESLLSPTDFMQSTHNTLGSLIAIQTGNHGYNCTWSHGNMSFESALADAVVRMRLGKSVTALVGCHDECTPDTFKVLENAGLTDGLNVPLSEGSAAFMLTSIPEGSPKAPEGALCEIAGFSVQENPSDTQLNETLGMLRNKAGGFDIVMTGENGRNGKAYDRVLDIAGVGETFRYKALFGESMSASALGTYAAAKLISRGHARNILLLNIHAGKTWSFILLKAIAQ